MSHNVYKFTCLRLPSAYCVIVCWYAFIKNKKIHFKTCLNQHSGQIDLKKNVFQTKLEIQWKLHGFIDKLVAFARWVDLHTVEKETQINGGRAIRNKFKFYKTSNKRDMTQTTTTTTPKTIRTNKNVLTTTTTITKRKWQQNNH